jgi:hypothetical protein
MPTPRTKVPTRAPMHIGSVRALDTYDGEGDESPFERVGVTHFRGRPGSAIYGGNRPAFYGGNVRALGFQPGLSQLQSIAYQALLSAGASPEEARMVANRGDGYIKSLLSRLSPGQIKQITGQDLNASQLLSLLFPGSSIWGAITGGLEILGGALLSLILVSIPALDIIDAPLALPLGIALAQQGAATLAPTLTGAGAQHARSGRPSGAPRPSPSFLSQLGEGLQEIPSILRNVANIYNEFNPPPESPEPFAPTTALPAPQVSPAAFSPGPSLSITPQPTAPNSPTGMNTETIPSNFVPGEHEYNYNDTPLYPSGGEPLEIQPQFQRLPGYTPQGGDGRAPVFPGPQQQGGERPTYPGPQGGDCPTCQTVQQLEEQTQRQLSDDTALKALGSTTPQQTQQIVDELRQIEDQLNQPTSPQQKQSILNRLRTLRQSCSNVCQQVKQKISFCMECDDQDEAMKFLNGEQAACNVIPGSQQAGGQPELTPSAQGPQLLPPSVSEADFYGDGETELPPPEPTRADYDAAVTYSDAQNYPDDPEMQRVLNSPFFQQAAQKVDAYNAFAQEH